MRLVGIAKRGSCRRYTSSDVASEHGDFVAQGQQFNLGGGLGAQDDQGESQDMAKERGTRKPISLRAPGAAASTGR